MSPGDSYTVSLTESDAAAARENAGSENSRRPRRHRTPPQPAPAAALLPDSTVLFQALPVRFKVPHADRRLLAAFAAALSQSVADRHPFTCLITGDKALRKLNRQFLGHDYATDVLSFPTLPGIDQAETNRSSQPEPLGDLAISIERAETQAAEYGHNRLDEVRVLMLHGLLHLLGFDHETDHGQMARAERKWRKHFGLPANLLARTRPARGDAKLLSRSTAELLS